MPGQQQSQIPPVQPPTQSYNSNHLAGQMANMNINGVQRPLVTPPQQVSSIFLNYFIQLAFLNKEMNLF
jgi:hypothetical protein